MDETPFPHQGPLEPRDVRGRDDLLADLTEKVTGRIVTALLGPRRFGKTSVLRRLAADLTEVATVWVDLYGATSVLDVAQRFDSALADTGGAFGRAARLEAANISVDLGMVRLEMARPPRDRPDPTARLDTLLDVLVAAALSTPTLLILDEFSSIANAGNTTALLRTKLQHHYSDIGLVFAGSEPSVMQTLFSDRAQPFFGQAELVGISPLSAAAATAIIRDGFTDTGRGAGAAPERIHHLTRGHPQRTMQVAHAVWSATDPGEIATDEVVTKALDVLRVRLDREMQITFDHQPMGAQQVLRLVANGHPLHGARAGAIDLAKNTSTHNRDSLLAHGELLRDDQGRLTVTDPMFADWLRTTLPL